MVLYIYIYIYSYFLEWAQIIAYPSINDSIIDANSKLIIWGNKDQWVPIMSAF